MSEDFTPEVEPVVEPAAEVVAEEAPKIAIVPVPVDIEAVIAQQQAAQPKPAGPAVITNNEVDPVKVSALIYKNLNARRSISVYHTQRRLKELGYVEAGADREGFLADGTVAALERFQKDNKIKAESFADLKTLEKLFKDDPNVKVEA